MIQLIPCPTTNDIDYSILVEEATFNYHPRPELCFNILIAIIMIILK